MDQQNENVKKISLTGSLERGQEEGFTTNLSKDQFKAAYGTDPPSWIWLPTKTKNFCFLLFINFLIFCKKLGTKNKKLKI